jgi:dUTP pyrophosphatase
MIEVTEMTEVQERGTTVVAKVKIKFKTVEGVSLPEYSTSGSSGMDVRSVIDCIIEPGSWVAVSTGLYPEIPEGYEIQVRSRSGLAFKNGIFVLNSPGTVDADYRGEIKVILANMGKSSFPVSKGDRIAQLVLSPVVQADISHADEISETERGSGGFGSTGKK